MLKKWFPIGFIIAVFLAIDKAYGDRLSAAYPAKDLIKNIDIKRKVKMKTKSVISGGA